MAHWPLLRSDTVKIASATFLFFLIALSFLQYVCVQWATFMAPVALTNAIAIEIPKGSTWYGLKNTLKEHNLLAQETLLESFRKWSHLENKLRAGMYEFPPHMTMPVFLGNVVSGREMQFSVRFLEGWTLKEVLTTLKENTHIKYDITDDSPLGLATLLGCVETEIDGSVFPETYFITHHTKATDILLRSRQALVKALDEAWQARGESLAIHNPHEALVLASIIEKETAQEQERGIISGVFHRRIAKNMRLQADPTVRYAFSIPAQTPIYKSDLTRFSPYNTYTIKGLPLGPICIPSQKSLMAAVRPVPGDVLYFVARKDGSHIFSSTLEAHNKAVWEMRQETP